MIIAITEVMGVKAVHASPAGILFMLNLHQYNRFVRDKGHTFQ